MQDKARNKIALIGYVLFAVIFIGAIMFRGTVTKTEQNEIERTKELYAPKIVQPANIEGKR